MEELGTILARLRGNRSDQQIAEAMQVYEYWQKYTIKSLRKLINEWENNRRTPNYSTLVELANFYGVTTDYLLGRQEQEYNYDSVETLVDVLSLDRTAVENLLKLSVKECGSISHYVLGEILKSPNFYSVMVDLKKSKDGITRQIHYLDKKVPNSFKEQCIDMADMYIVNAHKSFDVLLKDSLGYNTLMERISNNGNSSIDGN